MSVTEMSTFYRHQFYLCFVFMNDSTKCVDLKIKHNIKQFDAIIKWSYNDIMFTFRQLTI